MFLRCTLVLTMLAPPPEDAAVAAYNRGELDLALKLYRERAAAPGVHQPDALYGVHDALRALHSANNDLVRLCEAHELARDLIARGGFASDDERASWSRLEAEDAKLLSEAKAECPEQAPDPEPPPASFKETTSAAEEVPRDSASKPEGPPPPPGSKDMSPPGRPIKRIAGGSVLVVVGAGLLGGMAGALVGASRADGTIEAITAKARAEERDFTSAEQAEAYRADRSHYRFAGAAIGLGAAGVVSLVTGLAVMLAPARAASRERVRAHGAGLVYSF
ncbi:hypothetical protein [Nannocystis pusilla]|uniref:hypothetical protein n=1 Tax=Nannocystis pusilla TaxID=889268 RepID=UPI003DA3A623